MQSISPGIVRTEFAQRMLKDEEKGEKMYDQAVDGVSNAGPPEEVDTWGGLINIHKYFNDDKVHFWRAE